MGRYTGVVKKLPAGNSFGEIISNQVIGLTAVFDHGAARGARGPGGLVKGARVSFEIGGNGKAINIIRGYTNNMQVGVTGVQKRHQNKAN